MRLTIKTLEGNAFDIDVNETDNIAQVKERIEQARSDFPAAYQKLILTGKVLKDEQHIAELGMTDKNFLVCVVTKPKQTRPAAAAPAPVAAPAPAPAPAPARAPSTPTPAAAPTAAPASPARPAAAERAEDVQRLMDMGFPEAEVRAALRAAMGNPDVAVEFLFSGIPEEALRQASAGGPSTPAAAGGAGHGPEMLDALRRHPHINQLRRMVQANPAALQNILQQIGAQNPELLAVIHQNQQAFLEIMNEPVTEEEGEELGAGDIENMTPQQFVQVLRATPPEQRQQMAAAFGMTPEQFQGITDMIASMPPDQLRQMMTMFRGMGAVGGGAGAAGGVPRRPGAHTISLTEEEMAAVHRLMELGFDQNDAVQVFLACDKNEALAANVLMDGWNGGQGGLGGPGGDFGGDDENDDMYS